MPGSILRLAQRGPIVYPFLFAIYPILFLWSANVSELSLYTSSTDLLFPMAISVGITLFLLVGLWLVLRDWQKAALLVAFCLLLFFSYGHVQQAIVDSGFFENPRHRYLVPTWAVIFIAGGFLLFRYGSNSRNLTNGLNIISLLLVLFTLTNIVWYKPVAGPPLAEEISASVAADLSVRREVKTRPDIYYITTEGYSSSRILKINGIDNTPFINYLEGKGFYVADESNSNHSYTVLSLASSLSMETLDHFNWEDQPGGREVLYRIVWDNKVVRFLKARGYRIVYLTDRYRPRGRLNSGDMYFGCEKVARVAIHVDEFANALLQTTALEPFLRQFGFRAYRKSALRQCDFTQLVMSKDIDGPKLVIIHVLGPGYFWQVGPPTPLRYDEQVNFVNKGLKLVVDALLSDPDYSPVIVIQGDHGEYLGREAKEIPARMGILNAYHLPQGGNSLLYPSISPVNTFRVIFNYYFAADFDIVDDRSYFTKSGKTFGFLDVTDIVKQAVDD